MDQVKKRQVKKVLGWVSVVLVISLLAAMPLLARLEAEAEGLGASILSGRVEKGNIETVLRGGGTLAAQEAVKVTVPTGIKLDAFLVRNGDAVFAGDAVAEVDPVSVMNAIIQVQEKLDALKAEMAAADAENDGEVKAQAGGRVKAVYAEAGDRVRDVMLEHGALAVLSLDGRMAVKLTCDARLSVGEAVTVTLTDGADVRGRVESSLDGTVVVSLADEGYAIGETVTVSVDDLVLGSGKLYVFNAWNAVAWSGTVEAVLVGPEDTADAAEVLFELTDVESSGDLDVLVQEHREYEQTLWKLFRLYESGAVTAECDGVVSGIDEESALLLDNDSRLTDFSSDEITVLTVIPQETVTLTITLDERDIGKVDMGQIAQVKVDALKNQMFEAVVTAVSARGTNNGGSSKFTVELTMDRTEKMLAGMSASASITLEITEEVLSVPVAALCEIGSETMIYTGYDAEHGALTDPVAVTTGASDGITVQILSGLDDGDVYYYAYYDTPTLSAD